MPRMPVLPGAEPYAADGGPVGVLLVHGFTSSPQSLRGWAEHLAGEGFTVRLPRLPGHGTSWQELAITRWPDWFSAVERALDDLRARCDRVVVMGLSMGGALALRLAEVRGPAVAGLVLVNPSLVDERPALRALPVLRRVVTTVPGVGGDIAKPGVRELAYDRVPLAALASLVELWRVTQHDLPLVTQPLLVLLSAEDHVVAPASGRLLRERVSSVDVESVVLERSYHVATLDYDAEQVAVRSAAFARRVADPARHGPAHWAARAAQHGAAQHGSAQRVNVALVPEVHDRPLGQEAGDE